MKQNSFLKKFKYAIATVAVSTALFALSPLSAFAAAPTTGNAGYLDYVAETVIFNGSDDPNDCTEYSTDKGKTWYPVADATTPITTLNISKLIPAPGSKTAAEIALRVNSGVVYNDIDDTIGTFVATKGIVIPLPARPKAEGVSFDASTGKFKAFYDADVNYGLYTETVANGASTKTVFFVPASAKVTYTLSAVAGSKFKSAEGTVTVAPLGKAPAVTFDKTKNVVTKTTTAMEYILDITSSATATNWKECAPGTTDLSNSIDPAKVAAVRFKAVGSKPASSMYTFAASSVSGTAPEISANAADAIADNTDGYIDWDKEIIRNNKSKLQISLNKGATWTDVNAINGTSIATAIKPATATAATAVAEVRVRIAAADKTSAASKSASIFINKRPVTPASASLVTAIDYSAATISFAADTAYALSPTNATSTWTINSAAATAIPFATVKSNVASATDIVGKTIEIKTLPVTTDPYSVTPASAPFKYKLGTPAVAPAVTYTGLVGDYGSLKGATDLMEVATDSAFTANKVDVTIDADKLFALPTDDYVGKNLYVRVKGTDKAAPSLAKVIVIPAVTAAPTAGTFTTATDTAPVITGANTKYEIKGNNTGSELYIPYSPANFIKVLEGSNNNFDESDGTVTSAVTVTIRLKGTVTTPAGATSTVSYTGA